MNRKIFIKKFGVGALLASMFGSKIGAKEKAAEITVVAKKRARDEGIQPTLANPESSAIVFSGDLQRYSNDSVMQPIVSMMMRWIVKNKKRLNLKCALFTGDYVENNNFEKLGKGFNDADIASDGQWKSVSDAFGILDQKMAYIACTGNHDYGIKCFENRNTRFNEIFRRGRNNKNGEILLDTFPNAFGEQTLENACYEINLGGKWGKVVFFSIEFCPRDAVLDWVHSKCESDFADRKVVLLLHDYISMRGALSKKPSFSYVKVFATPEFNGGEDVWEKLVRKTPNIRLVLCGHSDGKTPSLDDNSAFREDLNDAGHKVFSSVFAMHGRRHDGHGADGWLRVLEFFPDGKTVAVSTFSPYLFYSLESKERSRAKNPKNEFSFVVE